MKWFSFLLVVVASIIGSANGQGQPPYPSETTPVEYVDFNNTSLLGHVAMPDGDGPFPAVIIVPDWDGIDEWLD